MDTKKIYIWIGAGVAVAAVIIFLGLNGSLPLPMNFSSDNSKDGTVDGIGTIATGTKPLVSGTSPVSKSGQVLTADNKPVKLNVEAGAPDAPKAAINLNKSDIPASAIKITMVLGSITPNRFEANSGSVITLAFTSADKYTHLFKFENPNLSALAVGLDPGETRAITFNAPAKGEYAFYCDVPGHRSRGETGVMTVK